MAYKLAMARGLFQPQERISGSSGWRTHIDKVSLAIARLKEHYEDREEYKNIFTGWRTESRELMSEENYDKWHLLIQYGVQELLYFLYNCLADLICKGEKERAVKVLVHRML